MDLGIRDHVAIVTGGGRGIGEGIALALGAEGCKVVVWDRDEAPAESVVEKIRAAGGTAMVVTGDVGKRVQVQAAVKRVIDAWGTVHILVNNAGFSNDAPITDMTEEQWYGVLDTCLSGVFFCCQAVVPAMISQHYGRIINISSRSSLGDLNKSNYAAAKAGVIGLTKALSLELGEHDITVNAIAPGIIEVDRLKTIRYYEEVKARALSRMPIQHMGQPEDIANGVLFLASARSGYVAGDVLFISGGRYG